MPPLSDPAHLTDLLTVINRGRCGQNSTILRERFEADLLESIPRPDHLLLYMGMNDVINDRFFTPLDRYCENMRWMLAQAEAAGVNSVVCTLHRVVDEEVYKHHPRHHFGSETVSGKIARYNVALRSLAGDMGVAVADFAAMSDFMPRASFLTDGVHLTPLGNALLARTFYQATAAPMRGTVVCLGDSLTYGYGNEGAGTCEGETYPAQLRFMAMAHASR